MSLLLKIYHLFKYYLIKFLEKFVVLILLMMVVTVFSGIIARYVLQIPLVWAEELALVGQIWLTFMGASLLYAYYAHLTVEAIFTYVSEKTKLILAVINQILVMPLFVVFIYGGLKIYEVTYKSVMPGLGVTVSIMYIPAILGGIFMLFFSIDQLVQAVKDLQEYRAAEREGVNAE